MYGVDPGGRDEPVEDRQGVVATAYADQTERDYEALKKAVKAGRLPAETGV